MTLNATVNPVRSTPFWLIVAGAAAVFGFVATRSVAPASPVTVVSQKGRAFSASSLDVTAGSIVRIVNDDGDLQHHAYIDAKDFQYDSGDQEPGTSIDIAFPKTGVFMVQCGIHPKMKMTVSVK